MKELCVNVYYIAFDVPFRVEIHFETMSVKEKANRSFNTGFNIYQFVKIWSKAASAKAP